MNCICPWWWSLRNRGLDDHSSRCKANDARIRVIVAEALAARDASFASRVVETLREQAMLNGSVAHPFTVEKVRGGGAWRH